MASAVQELESILGPDTETLRLRIGIHSGSVTRGQLDGQFKIVGKAVETASALQAGGHRHRIQLSHTTAELLRKDNKKEWIQLRIDESTDHSSGTIDETYWVVATTPRSGRRRRNSPTYQCDRSVASLASFRSARSGNSQVTKLLRVDNAPKPPKRRQVWGKGEDNFIMTLPPMSRAAKNKRLIEWVHNLLHSLLIKIVSQRREQGRTGGEFVIDEDVAFRARKGAINPFQEQMQVIRIQQRVDNIPTDRSVRSGETEVNTVASRQLRDMVTKISNLYKDDNPYSNFGTASHCIMSVHKLMNRCTNLDGDDLELLSHASSSSVHHYMNGIASNALAQFSILFAALVHNIGRESVSFGPSNQDDTSIDASRSVCQQKSIFIAWETLLDPSFKELQHCLFADATDLLMFRQLLVNCVLATDLSDKKACEWRSYRWNEAFGLVSDDSVVFGMDEEECDKKATVVVECLVQVGSISHMLQHWKSYSKFSERLFLERSLAFDEGRTRNNPVDFWYREELDFFDEHAIPLAKRLSVSSVFGVASDECLNHTLDNRKEFARQGSNLVQEMHMRYEKRKEMEIGGFTNDEIENLSASDLEYIMKKLVEKGRNEGTNNVHAQKGQNDAAQAWLDALEIYERCPAAMEMADRSVIFPIYSGGKRSCDHTAIFVPEVLDSKLTLFTFQRITHFSF